MGPNWGWWSICETSGPLVLFFSCLSLPGASGPSGPSGSASQPGTPRAEFAGPTSRRGTTESWAALTMIVMHGKSPPPPRSSILDPAWPLPMRQIDIAACRLSAAGFALHRRVPRPVHAYGTRLGETPACSSLQSNSCTINGIKRPDDHDREDFAVRCDAIAEKSLFLSFPKGGARSAPLSLTLALKPGAPVSQLCSRLMDRCIGESTKFPAPHFASFCFSRRATRQLALTCRLRMTA